MINIIVAFPKSETARSVKRLLVQNGHRVGPLCTTGAQALKSIDELDSGIVVSGYRFVDMMYTELHEYLPEQFEMLLVASQANCENRDISDLECLATPLKATELLRTVEMMEDSLVRRKRKMRHVPRERTAEERTAIDDAKALLMERRKMTEDEAHKYLQRRSMENGTGLTETARMIIDLMSGN